MATPQTIINSTFGLFLLFLVLSSADKDYSGNTQMHYVVGALMAIGAFVGSLAGSSQGARRGVKNPVVPTLIGAVVGAFAIPVGVAAIFIAVAFLVTWISGTRQ